MDKWRVFLLIIFCLNAAFAFAQEDPIAPHFAKSDLDRKKPGWIIPNEETPANAKPVLAHAPKGVYVAVGAERGFIGASLTADVTDLLLFDYNSGQVTFDALNIALLKMSRDR